ncbi:MAG: hypothetical protein R3C03_23205 [Pirellulaceae bacterium]
MFLSISTFQCNIATSICCLFLAITCGCSDGYPKRFPVKGVVRFPNGELVKTGTVEIGMPGSEWTASGKIERDGTFVLSTVNPGDGAIAGEHRVTVRQLIVSYIEPVGGHDHGGHVHRKYNDYNTSPLKLVVEEKANEVELVVELAEEN